MKKKKEWKMKKKRQSSNLILGLSVMILGILGSILLGYGIIVSEKMFELLGTLILIIAGAEPVVIEIIKSLFKIK